MVPNNASISIAFMLLFNRAPAPRPRSFDLFVEYPEKLLFADSLDQLLVLNKVLTVFQPSFSEISEPFARKL
jgi:hypothetical protein